MGMERVILATILKGLLLVYKPFLVLHTIVWSNYKVGGKGQLNYILSHASNRIPIEHMNLVFISWNSSV